MAVGAEDTDRDLGLAVTPMQLLTVDRQWLSAGARPLDQTISMRLTSRASSKGVPSTFKRNLPMALTLAPTRKPSSVRPWGRVWMNSPSPASPRSLARAVHSGVPRRRP